MYIQITYYLYILSIIRHLSCSLKQIYKNSGWNGFDDWLGISRFHHFMPAATVKNDNNIGTSTPSPPVDVAVERGSEDDDA